MDSILSLSSGETFTLIFGPHSFGFNERQAKELRSALITSQHLDWVVDTILELPQHWQSFSKTLPVLQQFPGHQHLEALSTWIRLGSFPEGSFPLPNILLTPLVVITHLVQYSTFIELTHSKVGYRRQDQDNFHHHAEILGLCTGLLSAAAVSCSANSASLKEHGPVAIRLAMAIGAFVDAKDTETEPEGLWKSASIRWNSKEAEKSIDSILQSFPHTYVSVITEEKTATVTTLRANAPSLGKKLNEAGATVVDIALRGAFHCEAYRPDYELLIKFFDENPAFQFPDTASIIFPTKACNSNNYLSSAKLHHQVPLSMIADQENWGESFRGIEACKAKSRSKVVAFGSERFIPQWLRRQLGARLLQASEFSMHSAQIPATVTLPSHSTDSLSSELLNEGIAVVGMSCRVPGAEDLSGFWDILCQAKSQHVPVPADRFGFETPWREIDDRKKWYGNFIQDYDSFDHKFFQSNPREASSTDPQHRLMLQAAYQAVEQSGYFNMPPADKHVGCYIGVGLVDYENNVGCHAPTAYTATGNLKSFAAGKISHYFGWTGPGLTIDTACSSSAVAIHQACRAILSGECSAALAGGINIMTSPQWFQNLAAASFLSPTGQCKPFDSNADGYCRGEGIGAVFLKKLSTAIEEGSPILGVIGATGVYQNRNCTAITVPNAISLSDLFSTVTRKAGLEPEQITVVEAHGTGTQVGDPAEYDSVRRVFGGPERSDSLSLGSVKGLIGHTESASGILALIKVLLMLHHGSIPPQASFNTINPNINAQPTDNIEISKQLKEWTAPLRAALINNYGASGSNASLVITQAPSHQSEAVLHIPQAEERDVKWPIWLTGQDDKSLRRYCAKLLNFIKTSPNAASGKLDIGSLSFQLARQSNRGLTRSLIFNCKSISEMEEKLHAFSEDQGSLVSNPREKSARPVILCFGGQISTFIGLDKDVYDRMEILKHYLDSCNETCLSLGLDSIFPDIFDKTDIQDVVKLQTALFAFQYSCAKSWIDCGIKVDAVVGHSFGELTAMCISGVLSLKDSIKTIARRATIIRDGWGAERGAMMAIECADEEAERLLSEVQAANPSVTGATIACFNAPGCFTVAGSEEAISLISETLSKDKSYASVKAKRVNVTHAFHSTLVEPLTSDLLQVGHDVVFRDAVIPWERATKDETGGELTSAFFVSHMRNPVYFHHAVERLSQKYPAAIWLEAGSNSTIANLASRAIGHPKSSHFQAINILKNGVNSLVESTTTLWKEGLNMFFWGHHSIQSAEYASLILPPYQFDRTKHWLELKKAPKALTHVSERPNEIQLQPETLFTLLSYQNRHARFRVNTLAEKYRSYVTAHVIAQTAPLCPSTFQLSIAMEALSTLMAGSNLQPELQGMDSHAPMAMDEAKVVSLDAEQDQSNDNIWSWKMFSSNANGSSQEVTLHVSGRIIFNRIDDTAYQKDFARYERIVDRKRCQILLDGNEAKDIIQGSRNIYRAFSETVQYNHEIYHGLQKLAGNGDESAGRIVAKHRGETKLDLGLADAFCQVAGIFLNTMTDLNEEDMLISDRIDQWILAPGAWTKSRPTDWEVYARHHRLSDKERISDIFVFDPAADKLVEVILGIHYVKVPRARMAKMLSRLAPGSSVSLNSKPAPPTAIVEEPLANGFTNGHTEKYAPAVIIQQPQSERKEAKTSKSLHNDIPDRTKELLANLLGLEPQEIGNYAALVDLGIDSLMAMEVTREIETLFKIELDLSALMELTDFQSLVKCILKALGSGDDYTNGHSEVEQEAEPMNHDSHQVNGHANGANGIHPHTNGYHTNGNSKISGEERIDPSVITDTFAVIKSMTDQYITDNGLSKYANHVIPKSNELCIVYIADAFDDLGCSLRKAEAGKPLKRIEYLPKHERFVAFIYQLLEEARLVNLDGDTIIRTDIPVPSKSADTILQELLKEYPDHAFDHRLTCLTGKRLSDCLVGKADGVQLIFSDPKGKESVAGMYAQSPINVAWLQQMMDFLRQLFKNLPAQNGPVKILELGAGTGGTTAKLVSLLGGLGVPFQYTVTDLSSSLVAGARKRFKQYPSMQFKVVDIEKRPSADLLHSQHLVIATNCVHATHSLAQSTKNIRDFLRPDGFLLMLEMTETIPWIDLVFGTLEGWWLFDDGRQHALSPPEYWQKTLKESGFGHVDWTDGNLPEAAIQRIIIALASSPSHNLVFMPSKTQLLLDDSANIAARQSVVDSFIQEYTEGFTVPIVSTITDGPLHSKRCVLVTGATGSLGSHLVAQFALQADVQQVICLNRRNAVECTIRQVRSLESKGLTLSTEALAKLKVLATDSSKHNLGLSNSEFEDLCSTVTDIVHNAWPMSATRPIEAFQAQFQTMKSLIGLAREAACQRAPYSRKITFQFISSIGTVGYHPLITGEARVPEKEVAVDSVLPSGYGEAKLVCERMLDETLRKYPKFFRSMSVRIGQITGSTTSGFWNPVEHFAFMVKSAQTLKSFPEFYGELSWCPVDTVAATLGELLLGEHIPYPIYHIENPARQSWRDMIEVLAKSLGIPKTGIVPFNAWLKRVRSFPPSLAASENPAAILSDFLETHFVRMSCGGLILDTAHSVEHSETLRNTGPVTADLVGSYIDTWKDMGFLRK